MKTLLVYPPFCSPASPPYSITSLYAFLKNNLPDNQFVDVLDANVEFHKIKFPKFKEEFQKEYTLAHYEEVVKEYMQLSKKTYSENNKLVVEMIKNNQISSSEQSEKIAEPKQPELFNEMLDLILNKKPDVVGFSIVYSSQAFYAYALMTELTKKGIKVVIGGPGVNEKLIETADAYLEDEMELLEYLTKKDYDDEDETEKVDHRRILNFNIFPKKDYFTSRIVLPLKTSSTCYYQKCSFCSHHKKRRYEEFSLDDIRATVRNSEEKYFFIVDDMIHKKRILELAKIMKENNAEWICQLKPTKEFDVETLKELKSSGLKFIIWGVESASNRILDLMKKQTNKDEIEKVLNDSKSAGIKNAVFIMFGFPTETKEEFLQSIKFLEDNQKNIDLLSTSVFGLQKDTPVYKHKEEFGIVNIELKQRTMLEPSITYAVRSGLSQDEATALKKAYKKTLDKFSKYPDEMNFFREHLLIFDK